MPLRGTPMVESYLELIGATTTRSRHEHEILIAVQIDARARARSAERTAAMRALVEQTERTSRRGSRRPR